MFTTATPGAQELSIVSKGAIPSNAAPYPTDVGTAITGRGDEPGHQPWQCAVHSGDDDDDPGGPELVEPAQDALQPGDTDIDHQVSRPAEIARGQLGLSGNSQVDVPVAMTRTCPPHAGGGRGGQAIMWATSS